MNGNSADTLQVFFALLFIGGACSLLAPNFKFGLIAALLFIAALYLLGVTR